ncbi:ATP-binding protein [Actinoplanes sp. NPDC051475]|uniref:hybrid sensor histidine kinase/response regulator n=1 Tax=Actinoplanes sp. NPDC051475 TaxID=3157225 RepID=UPI00344E3515
MALFVVAGVISLGSGWVLAERDGLSVAGKDARFGAGKAADAIGNNLAVIRSSVDAVASNPGAGKVFSDPASCQLSFNLGGPDDGHLDVLGLDGTVACSSRGLTGDEAAAYRKASWLPAVIRAPQVTGPVTDGRTGRPAVLVTAPMPGLGMVVAFVDLVGLGATVADLFGGPRGLEFLVTTGDGGTVLTRWPDGRRWAGTAVRESRFTAPDAAGEGSDVSGLPRVYGRAGVDGVGWRVYAGADRSAALAGGRRLAERQAVIAAIGLLAGLLATLLVYRRITQPIRRLRAAVHVAATTGDLESAVTVSGPREVSGLGAEFAALLATVDSELAERRRAEEVAREHERNYRQMFDASPYPIYLYDVETLHIVAANDAAVGYFGHTREQLLGMAVTDLCPVDDAALVAQAVSAAAPMERGRRLRHLKHDGTVTEVDVTSHLTAFAGRTVRCAVLDDVTEREQLQRRLRQSERLESLGQLAGGIAHDFNNLLGIINGYASMSAEDVKERTAGDPSWSRLHADLLEIVAAGDRAAGLTQQLLAFARADSLTELQVLDLNSVVANVEKLLRRTLGEDITLVTRLTPESRPVKANVGRLEQVLVNLAVNARDAMPDGGTLTIDTDEVTVDEHYTAQHPGVSPGRYMRLRVSDTGTGMSKATLDRAFEPFFTTKPTGQGTGLGLATIYGIITQFGGHAQIYSELGHGTTVGALLPITEDPSESHEKTATAPEPGNGQTILLAEDDDGLRALTERILHRNGYTVLSAATAAEARELAGAADGIDLLLSDVMMPDTHGPDLARALRLDRPSLPVVFMSGYAASVLAARSALPPGAVLLDKPVSAPQLLSTISRVLKAVDRIAAP